MNPSIIIALLYLTEKITQREADVLAATLPTRKIPNSWNGVVLDIESIIGRKIYVGKTNNN